MTHVASIPLDREAVDRVISRQNFDIRHASIREMNALVNTLEGEFEMRYIRMEFGIPGLPAHPIAIEAEAEALRVRGVGHIYAPYAGIPELKEEASVFFKNFLDIDVPAACCVPTVGAMEGCFAGLALAAQLKRGRDTVVLLQPGFPVNQLQARFLGLRVDSIDFFDHRGPKLIEAVDERLGRGDVCAVLWSSPNNPSWISLKETELEGLGRACDAHGVLAIEDLAYLGMDVRQDYYTPGQPPYQPTVMHYTNHGLCIVSSSKIFSYAGQRIAIMAISPELMKKDAPDLLQRLGTTNVGHALIHGVLYPIAASVPETPQYGLLALLQAANAGGNPTLFEPAREYARRAAIMKKTFMGNGFHLVYDNDLGEPLADGFYFTVAHPAFDHGADLLLALLRYGVSAITLETTGSCRKEGLRACVSLVADDQFEELEERLRTFHADHS